MGRTDRSYTVSVDGVGDFVFRRRVMRDQFRIHADTLRILGGPVDEPLLWNSAAAMATIGVLMVSGPDGWDVEELDPLAPEDLEGLYKVHGRLLEEEERFRGGAQP
ncbi:hypothetical protein TSO221_18455 [Azospirillum sp. TSO22-1]|nr:hypothetical protein TSO221_18455 [Azospirillum sp. TSO22-1]